MITIAKLVDLSTKVLTTTLFSTYFQIEHFDCFNYVIELRWKIYISRIEKRKRAQIDVFTDE